MKIKLGFIFLLVLLTGACQHIETVNIYKMESFSEIDEESLIVIKDSDDIRDIQAAFNNAKKESGIVNMVDPHYKVKLGEEAFFLWVSEETGTIMNLNDTHTIYTLSGDAVIFIKELIKK